MVGGCQAHSSTNLSLLINSDMKAKTTKKKTLEEVIEKFREAHGDLYDYSLVKYVNNNTKVTIVCPTHSAFEQIPRSHDRGIGCPECGVDKVGASNRHNADKFISRAEEKFPGKFTYSKVEYKNSATPVTVTCVVHGDVDVKPRTFLAPHSIHGCKQCYWDSKNITLEYFLTRAKSIHGGRYDYKNVTSIESSQTKVPIICRRHGEYSTTAAIHLSGFNCPSCQREDSLGGYSHEYFSRYPDRKGWDGTLYLVRFENKENSFVKVGISKTLKTRFAGYPGYKKTVLFRKDMTIYEAFVEEQKILTTPGLKRFVPTDELFSGKYECFSDQEADKLLLLLNTQP